MLERHVGGGCVQSVQPAVTRPRGRWLLWIGLALMIAALANVGCLLYGAALACHRFEPGGPSPLFGLQAARVRWGVGAMFFGTLSMVCALSALRRARGWYVKLALAEIAFGGLPLPVVLAVYWIVWGPM